MSFAPSNKVLEMKARLARFMDEHIYPVEHDYYEFVEDQNNLWRYPPFFEDLKSKAREAGIWNWFLPHEYTPWSPGLTNLEFAPLMEVMSAEWPEMVDYRRAGRALQGHVSHGQVKSGCRAPFTTLNRPRPCRYPRLQDCPSAQSLWQLSFSWR